MTGRSGEESGSIQRKSLEGLNGKKAHTFPRATPSTAHLSCPVHLPRSCVCACSRSVSNAIGALTRLTYLNLSNNMLDDLPGGMAALNGLQVSGG